jgi:DNA modification methylase
MTETSSEPLLLLGDCLDRLREMPDNSVDSVVTDPPYGLSFMGKKWDYDVPSEEIWRECLRVLKPGGHLLAFAGTRTQHRMAVRIEDAGFEIRDMIAWVYASGFPKSLDVSKAIDKAAGAEREVLGSRSGGAGKLMEDRPWNSADGYDKTVSITAPATEAAKQWQGWGTALKPALEPITVARKPLGEKTVAANVLAHGTGGINVDGCRVSAEGESFDHLKGRPLMKINNRRTDDESLNGAAQQAALAKLKDLGRWPANLIHDGSDEVVGLFPVVHGAGKARAASEGTHRGFHEGVTNFSGAPAMRFGDSGSAARFFKCCPPETLDLLFCRAKSILSAWKIKNVSHAESSLPQQKQAVASVLSDAVILVSQGDKRLSDVRGLSTTVTASEFEKLCETLITAMLILESGALPDLLPDAPIQNGCLVNVAVIQKPTDTTTITINLPTSGGYADPVTFSITPQNLDHGAKDLSADRFKYCAKASKKDRDEGCKGLETQNNMRVNGPRESEEAKHATKRSNFHPTVKPTALMRYLCRLVTPPGGIVLDPFMGSGSTGKAAMLDGFQFIGIERDEEYMEIAKARIGAASNEHA